LVATVVTPEVGALHNLRARGSIAQLNGVCSAFSLLKLSDLPLLVVLDAPCAYHRSVFPFIPTVVFRHLWLFLVLCCLYALRSWIFQAAFDWVDYLAQPFSTLILPILPLRRVCRTVEAQRY
jgi:hypothetical protein